jgi:hypothetical protein
MHPSQCSKGGRNHKDWQRAVKYSLVELDIVQVDRFSLGGPPLRLQQHPVVQPQLALWHAAEVGPHLERPHNLRPHQLAVAVHQDVDTLNNVQEDLQHSTATMRLKIF